VTTETEIPNLRGGGLSTLAFILGPLFGAVVVLLGIAWQAAKYPDRSEFELMRNDTTLTKQDVAIMKVQDSGRDARLNSIEIKIDKLLEESRQRVRTR
jgi:hypothetical protein